MSQLGETFFTVVGCMDGRCQKVVSDFGHQKFGTMYPDTLTEPGIVGMIAKGPSDEFTNWLKAKLLISIEKHHSNGIIVDGHEECAGNPVSEEQHKQDIQKSVEYVKELTRNVVPVVGVFVKRSGPGWIIQEL